MNPIIIAGLGLMALLVIVYQLLMIIREEIIKSRVEKNLAELTAPHLSFNKKLNWRAGNDKPREN